MHHLSNTPANRLYDDLRRYTTQGRRIVTGSPAPTDAKTADELKAMGFVGLYAIEQSKEI